MAIQDTIDKIRRRGKFNLNTAKAQFESLKTVSYPDDGVGSPPITEIGRWDFYADWDFVSDLTPGQIRSFDGDTPNGNSGLNLNQIDKNSNDVGAVLSSIGYPNMVTLLWKENGVLVHTFENMEFGFDGDYDGNFLWYLYNGIAPFTMDFGSYPADGTEITLEYQPPSIPPSPQKSFVLEYSQTDYTGIGGIEYNSNLVSDINVQGKDTHLRVDIEIPAAGITDDIKPAFVFLMGTGTNSFYPVDMPIFTNPSSLNPSTIRSSRILPVKLGNYEWFQLIVQGQAPFVPGLVKVRFTYMDIQTI